MKYSSKHLRLFALCVAMAASMFSATAGAKDNVRFVIASSRCINHVLIPEGKKVKMQAGKDGDNWAQELTVIDRADWERIQVPNATSFIPWQLVREKDKTVLHCYMPGWESGFNYLVSYTSNIEYGGDTIRSMWVGGEESVIFDTESGVSYVSRGSNDMKLWNQHFSFVRQKDQVYDFTIEFPPLPKSTRKVRIYGIPVWNLRGNLIQLTLPETTQQYDATPKFHEPSVVKPENNYDRDDMSTYARYGEPHFTKAMPDDREMAIWRTKDATYLAVAYNLNWGEEYFVFPTGLRILDHATGKVYGVRRIQGLPLDDRMFMMTGPVGSWFAVLMEFPPLPLDTYSIDYYEPEIKPTKAWQAILDAWSTKDLSIQQLVDNQKLFKYIKPKMVK